MGLTARGVVVLVAAVLVAALTARLGVWQLDRADQKNRLQQALQDQRRLPALQSEGLAREPAAAVAQQHRAVMLQGRWSPAQTVYLENRQMNGRPGFFALTPLLLDDGSAVLVQRGWLPRDLLDRTRISAPPAPPGRVHVQGRLAATPSLLYDFEGSTATVAGPIRQNLELQAFARETGLRLLPLTVVQEDGATDPSTPQDGLLRQWPQPAADVHKHYGYAFQWFAMSALIIGLYVWFQLIRPRRQPRPARA